jgi:peptidoglycan hydrolase-like protein with peptidoglycan-binding domain
MSVKKRLTMFAVLCAFAVAALLIGVVPAAAAGNMSLASSLVGQERRFATEATAAPDNPTMTTPATSLSACPPTIQRGSQGDWVRILQSELIYRGYDVGPTGIDGKFGGYTEAAVKHFQQDYRLLVDGIVGPQTWGALGYC